MFNSNCFAADDVKELHFGGFLTKKSTDDKQVIVPWLYISSCLRNVIYYSEVYLVQLWTKYYFFDENAMYFENYTFSNTFDLHC